MRYPVCFHATLSEVRPEPCLLPPRFPVRSLAKHRRLHAVSSANPPRYPTSVLATFYWL